MHEQATEL